MLKVLDSQGLPRTKVQFCVRERNHLPHAALFQIPVATRLFYCWVGMTMFFTVALD